MRREILLRKTIRRGQKCARLDRKFNLLYRTIYIRGDKKDGMYPEYSQSNRLYGK